MTLWFNFWGRVFDVGFALLQENFPGFHTVDTIISQHIFRVFLYNQAISSSPNKCCDQGDFEVPNLIEFEVHLPIGNHPTCSGKYVPKYLFANIHLTGCVYTAPVAPSAYLIIPGLPWLLMLTGVLHTSRTPPELDTLSFTLGCTKYEIHYFLWPCWSWGQPVLHGTSVGKTFLAAVPRNSPLCIWQSACRIRVQLWGLGGVRGGGWMYLVFPSLSNWPSSSRPAGGTVNQLQQLTVLLQPGKTAPSFPELKHQLCFFSLAAWLNT